MLASAATCLTSRRRRPYCGKRGLCDAAAGRTKFISICVDLASTTLASVSVSAQEAVALVEQAVAVVPGLVDYETELGLGPLASGGAPSGYFRENRIRDHTLSHLQY